MTQSHFAAVRAFHQAIDADTPETPHIPAESIQTLRRTLLTEEFNELMHALDQHDLVSIAGEAIDLLYVTYGLCVAYGIDADAVFAEVQRANMAKTTGARRADGKQLKPEGWTPPDIAGVLARQTAHHASPIETNTGSLHIEIIFDGGADPNPGKGYGSYRLTVNGEARPVKRLQFAGTMTNNEAEYSTLIAALTEIQRRSRDLSKTSVIIKGDSQLVIKQITGVWKAKDPRMAALRDQVKLLLHDFGKWQAQWHDRSNSVEILGH